MRWYEIRLIGFAIIGFRTFCLKVSQRPRNTGLGSFYQNGDTLPTMRPVAPGMIAKRSAPTSLAIGRRRRADRPDYESSVTRTGPRAPGRASSAASGRTGG